MANRYSLGIDVGSTTVKTVITDTDGNIIYSKYQRHLSKVKEKFILNLTKRQIICFSLAALVGVPSFFFVKEMASDISTATLVMMFLMLPFFFIALYEKDGMNCETIFKHMIEWGFKRPKERPYRTRNYYAALMRQKRLNEEVEDIVISFVQKKKKT